MIKSDSIKEIATALSLAQGEFDKAKKDSNNNHFKSNFANLESVVDASRPALVKHGLSVTQLLGIDANDKPTLTTILMHKSGEFIQSTILLPITKPGSQELGSCSTYMKRYSLTAILGLADTDDDGEAAEGRHEPQSPVKSEPKPNKQIPNMAPTHPISLGDTTMPFGRTKGIPLKQLTSSDIKNAIEWSVSKGKFLDFVSKANGYLAEISIHSSDLVPEFNPDDELPF